MLTDRRCAVCGGSNAVGALGRPRDDASARPLLAPRGCRLGRARLRRAVRDPPAAVDGGPARGAAAARLAAGRVRRRLRGGAADAPVLVGHRDRDAGVRGSASRAVRAPRGRCGRARAACEAAAAVNRIGDVRWLPVGEIARANHELRVVGARLELRPFARRLQLEPPAGVAEIQVDAPGDAVDPGALVGWSVGEGAVRPFGAAVAGRGTLDIRLHGRHVADPAAVAPPVWRPWPRVRRTATEARDRVLPLAPAARAPSTRRSTGQGRGRRFSRARRRR